MVIEAGKTDKCPHCNTSNRFEYVDTNQGEFTKVSTMISKDIPPYIMKFCRCTSCHKIIIFLDDKMIFPLGSTRPQCPKEVPDKIAKDYTEACLVESYSAKAAAALARRCLQNMLHEQGIEDKNLSKEIDLAIIKLPPYLAEAIDAIRQIGNFSAHAIKSEHSGEIVEIKPGEAEWALETLYSLFSFYYVDPKILKEKKNAFDAKLKDAGKKPLK